MSLRDLIIDTRKTNDRLRREKSALLGVIKAVASAPEGVTAQELRRMAEEVLKTIHA